jgi:hypothetical protein
MMWMTSSGSGGGNLPLPRVSVLDNGHVLSVYPDQATLAVVRRCHGGGARVRSKHSTPSSSSVAVRLLLVMGLLSPRLQLVVKQVDGQRQGLLQLVVRAMIVGKLEEIVDDHLPSA